MNNSTIADFAEFVTVIRELSNAIPKIDPHPDNHFERLLENMEDAGYDGWLSKLENVELELLYKEASLHAEYDRLGRYIDAMGSITDGTSLAIEPCVSEKKRRIALYVDLKRVRAEVFQVRELYSRIDSMRMEQYAKQILEDAEENEQYL